MSELAQAVAKRALREGDTGPAVKALQLALRKAGHELVIDGSFGGATRAAVERFQATSRIAADGYVGPITVAHLDAVKPVEGLLETPLPSVLLIAPWLTWMRANTGTREIPGGKSNPLILSWPKAIGLKYPSLRSNIDWYVNDATPWCGLGEAAALALGAISYKPPEAPLWALNWRHDGTYGRQLDEPCLACIMVKQRTGGGHVTTYESEDEKFFYCRGANQSNMINVAAYSKKDKWTFHWPLGAPPPITGRVRRKFNNAALNPSMV